MQGKILVAAISIPGIWDTTDAASQLARVVRSNDRALASSDLVQLPLVDGGKGTIDFLVSHTLGSFLEVEATGASGEDVVVPIGFAGEDGKLAVIEMARVAHIQHPGESGTTAGVGQLIQDALDEGAFSIILGHEEPLACDAGLGAASALGVRFFDKQDNEVNFSLPGASISSVAKIDVSGRSFSLLSSRVFIARSSNDTQSIEDKENKEFRDLLAKLAEIIRRDTGIQPSTTNLSMSAIEFGLSAFLGAEVRNGTSLVLEASNISDAITHGEFSEMFFLTPSLEALENEVLFSLFELVRTHVSHRAIIVANGNGTSQPSAIEKQYFLQDVPLFQASVHSGSSIEEKQRDLTMRLEKIVPTILEDMRKKTPAIDKQSKGTRA
jgi:glycerate kinase